MVAGVGRDLQRVSAADLILPTPAEGSAEMAARVAAARARQAQRYGGRGLAIGLNAHAPPALLDEVAAPDPAGLALLRDAADAMRLTARAYHRVLKLARTIADLDAAPTVRRVHLVSMATELSAFMAIQFSLVGRVWRVSVISRVRNLSWPFRAVCLGALRPVAG